MVTTSIFIIITLVVLVNYPRANGAIALRLLAHDLALSIREAQVYGVSIRGTLAGTQAQFPDYGMYFDTGALDAYILFRDVVKDSLYNPSDSSNVCSGSNAGVSSINECLQEYKIRGVNQIKRLCGLVPSSGTIVLTKATCWNGATESNFVRLKSVNVVFRRPNPNALMKGKNSDDAEVTEITVAGILVGNKNETDPARMRMITVWKTGQITTESE